MSGAGLPRLTSSPHTMPCTRGSRPTAASLGSARERRVEVATTRPRASVSSTSKRAVTPPFRGMRLRRWPLVDPAEGVVQLGRGVVLAQVRRITAGPSFELRPTIARPTSGAIRRPFGGGFGDGGQRHPLAVEEQAVHVEDDGVDVCGVKGRS
jgi:hypothetical protein